MDRHHCQWLPTSPGCSFPGGAKLERPPCCIPQWDGKFQSPSEDVRRDHQRRLPVSALQEQRGGKLPGSAGELWFVRELPQSARGCHTTQCSLCPPLLHRSLYCRGHVEGKSPLLLSCILLLVKVIINDELRELVLPTDLQSSIWGQEQGGFHDGGIESVVPFHYPALLSTYTESLLFPSPSDGGLLLRKPALKKLKVS